MGMGLAGQTIYIHVGPLLIHDPEPTTCTLNPRRSGTAQLLETMASFSALDPFKLSAIKLTTNKLGTGSYASVYEVNYLGLKCAGKKIHEVLLELEQSGEATYALTRFAEECRLLSRMRHPNIVQFLGVYFEKGMKVPVLIMEFLPTNLSSCIEHNGILRSEISYSILHDVSLGLNYLHSHSPPIIHRDLSSNNVLLAASMKAKISDLGVAKILNLTPLQVSRVVRNTETPGTGAYMPPEAMIANPTYNTSIDVFSYGVLMIHVFSGQWPEPQCGPIQVEGRKMIPKSEADRRQKFLDMIGEKHPLMDLILRCIDIDPKRRPSANEVVPHLNDMVTENPPPFSTQLEMLQRIDAKSEELQLARQEITKVEAELQAIKDKQQGWYAMSKVHVNASSTVCYFTLIYISPFMKLMYPSYFVKHKCTGIFFPVNSSPPSIVIKFRVYC